MTYPYGRMRAGHTDHGVLAAERVAPFRGVAHVGAASYEDRQGWTAEDVAMYAQAMSAISARAWTVPVHVDWSDGVIPARVPAGVPTENAPRFTGDSGVGERIDCREAGDQLGLDTSARRPEGDVPVRIPAGWPASNGIPGKYPRDSVSPPGGYFNKRIPAFDTPSDRPAYVGSAKLAGVEMTSGFAGGGGSGS